ASTTRSSTDASPALPSRSRDASGLRPEALLLRLVEEVGEGAELLRGRGRRANRGGDLVGRGVLGGGERAREAALVLVDREHVRRDLLPDLHDLLRVIDPAAGAELGDVHEALDPGRDLDEGAELREPRDRAAHA